VVVVGAGGVVVVGRGVVVVVVVGLGVVVVGLGVVVVGLGAVVVDPGTGGQGQSSKSGDRGPLTQPLQEVINSQDLSRKQDV